MSTPTTWTAYEIAFLTERWLIGDTALNIAVQMKTGKSRNAIIGKARRLGITHPKGGPRAPRSKTERVAPIIVAPPVENNVVKIVAKKDKKPPKFFPPAIPIPGRNPIAITKLRNHNCRAIVGHDDSIHHLAVYCGDQVFPGKPYCPIHCKLFFRPYEARKRYA